MRRLNSRGRRQSRHRHRHRRAGQHDSACHSVDWQRKQEQPGKGRADAAKHGSSIGAPANRRCYQMRRLRQSNRVWATSECLRLARAASAVATSDLLGRAGCRPVRAEHAAVARRGAQQYGAAFALIEELAGIGRHRFFLAMAALRTADSRRQDRFVHGKSVAVSNLASKAPAPRPMPMTARAESATAVPTLPPSCSTASSDFEKYIGARTRR